MATYIYETIPSSKTEEPIRFEFKQGMNDEPLTRHPDSGLPVKRVITGGYGFNVSGSEKSAPRPRQETVVATTADADACITSVSPVPSIPPRKMKICLLEPFFTGSHERWAKELARRSRHQIDIISLPGRHWKWRMHGGAITLADQFMLRDIQYDAILASDMLDLSLFLSRIRQTGVRIPVGLYFHENQLLYPWSPRDGDKKMKRDLHYSFINYTSALAADRLYFNSDYHRTVFLDALPGFLKDYPDFQNLDTTQEIRAKASTLWLGTDLKAFDQHRCQNRGMSNARPLILWNHRWEYDKNPIGFFRILYGLIDRGIEFDVALLGEGFKEEPPYFLEAKERLGNRVAHYGKLPLFSDYARYLWQADISLVTSNQDFFGQSVVESIYCGCHPVLPNRLAYPDHLNPKEWSNHFYDTEEEALERVTRLIQSNQWKSPFRECDSMSRYDWTSQIGQYDSSLEELVLNSGT